MELERLVAESVGGNQLQLRSHPNQKRSQTQLKLHQLYPAILGVHQHHLCPIIHGVGHHLVAMEVLVVWHLTPLLHPKRMKLLPRESVRRSSNANRRKQKKRNECLKCSRSNRPRCRRLSNVNRKLSRHSKIRWSWC